MSRSFFTDDEIDRLDFDAVRVEAARIDELILKDMYQSVVTPSYVYDYEHKLQQRAAVLQREERAQIQQEEEETLARLRERTRGIKAQRAQPITRSKRKEQQHRATKRRVQSDRTTNPVDWSIGRNNVRHYQGIETEGKGPSYQEEKHCSASLPDSDDYGMSLVRRALRDICIEERRECWKIAEWNKIFMHVDDLTNQQVQQAQRLY